MRLVLYVVAMVVMAVSAALGAEDATWTRALHQGKDIYSVHVCDTMGVSTDGTTIMMWDAKTGSPLDSMKFGNRRVRGAWLIEHGDVLVVFVLDSSGYPQGSMLWFQRTTKAWLDSLAPIYQSPMGRPAYAQDQYAAISDDDSIVFVSCVYTYMNAPCERWFRSSRFVDIRRRVLLDDRRTPADDRQSVRPRFESRDSVVTFFPALGDVTGSFSSTSPSGRYQCNGMGLFNATRNEFVRALTLRPWYVGRYGPTDATILAYRRRDTVDASQQPTSFLQLCVINVFTDSVLQIVDTLNVGVWNTWSDRTGLTIYTFGNGIIQKSIVDTAAYDVDPACVVSVPDRLVSDSLYLIGAELFPLEDPLSLVVDKGDGSPIVRTLYCSWHAPGSYTCRAGVVRQQDTVWVCSKHITVSGRSDSPPAVERFFLERSSVLTIDNTHRDSILVTTDYGWLVAFDRGLHMVGCAKTPSRIDGACWTAADDVQWYTSARVSEVSCARHATSYRFGNQVQSGLADLTTSSLRVTDGKQSAVDVQYDGDWMNTTVQTLGADGAGTLWCLVAISPEDQPKSSSWPPVLSGGIWSVRSGQFSAHGPLWSGRYPNFNYYGVFRVAGLSSDGKNIVGLFYSYLPSGNSLTKHFALFDIAADSIVDMIDGSEVAEIRCIGTEHAVADSTWLSIYPFHKAGAHSFTRPFAEDAVPGHAIAWKNGWFYSFSPNGRVHDSVQADTMRPRVIRVFPDGRIIAGYASGMVAVYGTKQRDLKEDPTEGGSDLIPLSCWPSPTTSELSYALPPSMSTPATMEIYDLQGRLCGATTLTEHHGKVDITSIMNMDATGVFIVRAHASSVVAYAKIVVVK